jgi:type II secretory pathway component PulC
MRPLAMLLLVAIATVNCAGSDRREPVTPTIVPDDPLPDHGDYTIDRARYETVLKEGLQHVMRWYFVKPSYRGEQFIGYQIAEILNPDLASGPLRVGDILLAVNGDTVERPEHAMAVWRGLWARKTLDLKILRKGQPMHYSIPIVSQDK